MSSNPLSVPSADNNPHATLDAVFNDDNTVTIGQLLNENGATVTRKVAEEFAEALLRRLRDQ